MGSPGIREDVELRGEQDELAGVTLPRVTSPGFTSMPTHSRPHLLFVEFRDSQDKLCYHRGKVVLLPLPSIPFCLGCQGAQSQICA